MCVAAIAASQSWRALRNPTVISSCGVVMGSVGIVSIECAEAVNSDTSGVGTTAGKARSSTSSVAVSDKLLEEDVVKFSSEDGIHRASIFQDNRRRWDPVSHTYSIEWHPRFIAWFFGPGPVNPIKKRAVSSDFDALVELAKEWCSL